VQRRLDKINCLLIDKKSPSLWAFFMLNISTILKYFGALSLDVTFGGIIGSLFISAYLGVSVDFKTYIVLGLTIWLIYTLDHLIDTHNASEPPITFRHRFHWKNSIFLWGIWSFLLIMALSMLFKLPQNTLYYGAIVAGSVIIYFVSLKLFGGKQVYHKEFAAAIIYTAGVFIPSISLIDFPIGLDIWILFVEMFSLALINLLIFSLFERAVDKHEGYHSLVGTLDQKNVKGIIWGLVFAVLGLSSFSPFILDSTQFILSQFIIFMMNATLAFIMLKSDFFIINTRYRILGDAVFGFPAFYMIIYNVV
jgi:hypothetical protein